MQPRTKLGRWTAELETLEGQHREAGTRAAGTDPDIRGAARRGYDGSYGAVRRHAGRWAEDRGHATAAAYVPLSLAPGDAHRFDRSHEIVVLNGVTVTVKVAPVRLGRSRMLFVRAYPRETQAIVLDAHDRAFALFRGACGRGIGDDMNTAVGAVLVGKNRLYNRRFLQTCSHDPVEPAACTPASGRALDDQSAPAPASVDGRRLAFASGGPHPPALMSARPCALPRRPP